MGTTALPNYIADTTIDRDEDGDYVLSLRVAGHGWVEATMSPGVFERLAARAAEIERPLPLR